MADLNNATHKLVEAVRKTEMALGRKYRTLPQAGIYQGVQK